MRLGNSYNGHNAVRGKIYRGALFQLFQALAEPSQGRILHVLQHWTQLIAHLWPVNKDSE